ncbi:MAG: pilus assembly protein PilM [Actinomycetota bacterium]|jgi:type IV pilus assembly protein PilM|nr:pilus assembly protein PilM [Actinomycetota bacterium]MDD5601233.1 pilus assembly protein PilM [Actinomycetota bacterium]
MLAIGLNLSSSVINIVELANKGRNIIVRKVVKAEVPADCIIKGEIQKPDILAANLKEIWRRYRISDRKVYVGIANQKVIAKEVKIPVINDAEIKSSIQYQISDFIPIPKNNIIYDYYVVEKGKDHSRVMLVGAMKSMIDDVVYSFKNAGLLTQAIDLNCFALFRTVSFIHSNRKNEKVEKTREKDKADTYCVVNLGDEMSIIEMVQNNDLKYPRFSSTSYQSFIDEIYKGTKKDNKYCEDILSGFDFKDLMVKKSAVTTEKLETEDTKLKAGPKTKTTKKAREVDENLSESRSVEDIIKKVTDQFIDEIGLSIEHFMQENPKSSIGKIVLTGKFIKNIDKYIEQQLQHRVELLNITDYFSLKYLKKISGYSEADLKYILDPIAVGMALRGLNQ